MKTFRFIGMALFVVLMCVNLASCSSSDDDPTEEPEEGGVVVSGKKIAKVVSVTEPEGWKETRTFAYDDKGRLIKSTEIDEFDNQKNTRTYQFIWGDDAIKCTGDNSYTLSLKNGLAQNSDKDHVYSYNNSNRLAKVKTSYETTTAIWDGDKLVSISEDGHDITLTYKESCKKGYFPFTASLIEGSYDDIFMAHPELVGTRTTQLPASQTWEDENETATYSYEFDKDGYISIIKGKSSSGSTQIITLTWQ